LTRVQSVVRIQAPVETVWSVLTDPTYISKLYPDIISAQVDPPGPFTVGQKHHMVGRAGRRKLEIFAEPTEIQPNKRLVTRNDAGGLFKSFEETILTTSMGKGTEVSATFEYELSMGYAGKIFNMLVLERTVKDNLAGFTRNLKDLSELLPLPP
jgi:uncharacterized protein YndB with AHSA1/START domain